MAKLYWRIKVNGKWTWRPADTYELDTGSRIVDVVYPLEEEE